MLTITLELLPPEFGPSSALRSFGTEFVWTDGRDSTADIWWAAPGAAPVRLYENPRPELFVPLVTKSERGYAFVEMEDIGTGVGAWWVRYLPAGAPAPIEVDTGLAPNSGGPTGLAMDGRRLAWATYEEPATGERSLLRVTALDDLERIETLRDEPIETALFWDVSLEGDRLWYAVIDPDFQFTGVGDEIHIESIDLESALRGRERFAGTANDFHPVVTEDYIAWKTVEPGSAALNWGTLHVQDRRTGRVVVIPVERAGRPSIGSRFVAFPEFTNERLLLYDLVEQQLADATLSLPPGTTVVAQQSVAGDLLVCMVSVADGPPQIAWGWLPPR